MKIGYLIPEFPGQTHVFFWREVIHMREAGVDLSLFSTQLPPQRDSARHAFVETAIKQTIYLWPRPVFQWLFNVIQSVLRHPIGFMKCVKLVVSIPIDRKRVSRRKMISLLVPACIFAKEAKRRRITHLHCHSCANCAVLALLLKRLTGIPYSLVVHADLGIWKGALGQKLQEAEFNMVITQRLLDDMSRDYPLVRDGQKLLGRMGVDTEKWVPDRSAVKPHKEFRIVTVGRLHTAKGHDYLLMAVGQLVQTGRDISLLLIGDGPKRQELESLTTELGIDQRVTFLGSASEDRIIEEMNSADAFVLASLSEPLGVAYMEAMAMELPTVGTRAGGLPELITDGMDGLLVEPEDENGLAGAIAKLMDDPDLRSRLGRAGRKTIVAKFDSRVGARTLLDRLMQHTLLAPPKQ